MYNILLIVDNDANSYFIVCVLILLCMRHHISCADFAALLLVILDVIAMSFSVIDPLALLLLS